MSANIYVYDIETSPNLCYTWGLYDQTIGLPQVVETQDIMCFAATKVGSNKIESHAAWDSDTGYDDMIARLHEIMCDADYLVGYNHQAYDNKHVRAAFIRAGLEPPSPHRNVDLMRVVKANFKFQSNKLAHVCEQLGLDLKTDPGGFETWRQILEPGVDEVTKRRAQKRMVRYCRNDVKITAQLYERLLPWTPGLNVPMYSEADGETHCTRCESTNIHRRGWAYTTTSRYKRYRCMDCGGWMRARRAEPMNPERLSNAQ